MNFSRPWSLFTAGHFQLEQADRSVARVLQKSRPKFPTCEKTFLVRRRLFAVQTGQHVEILQASPGNSHWYVVSLKSVNLATELIHIIAWYASSTITMGLTHGWTNLPGYRQTCHNWSNLNYSWGSDVPSMPPFLLPWKSLYFYLSFSAQKTWNIKKNDGISFRLSLRSSPRRCRLEMLRAAHLCLQRGIHLPRLALHQVLHQSECQMMNVPSCRVVSVDC